MLIRLHQSAIVNHEKFLPSQDKNWHTFHTPAPEPLPWTTAGDCMCPEFSMFMAFSFLVGPTIDLVAFWRMQIRFPGLKESRQCIPFFRCQYLTWQGISSTHAKQVFWSAGLWKLTACQLSDLCWVSSRMGFPIRFLSTSFSLNEGVRWENWVYPNVFTLNFFASYRAFIPVTCKWHTASQIVLAFLGLSAFTGEPPLPGHIGCNHCNPQRVAPRRRGGNRKWRIRPWWFFIAGLFLTREMNEKWAAQTLLTDVWRKNCWCWLEHPKMLGNEEVFFRRFGKTVLFWPVPKW